MDYFSFLPIKSASKVVCFYFRVTTIVSPKNDLLQVCLYISFFLRGNFLKCFTSLTIIRIAKTPETLSRIEFMTADIFKILNVFRSIDYANSLAKRTPVCLISNWNNWFFYLKRCRYLEPLRQIWIPVNPTYIRWMTYIVGRGTFLKKTSSFLVSIIHLVSFIIFSLNQKTHPLDF